MMWFFRIPKFLLSILVFSFVLLLAKTASSVSLTSFINQNDRTRLKGVFDQVWKAPALPGIHSSILGYKLLGLAVPNPKDVCSFLLEEAGSKNLTPENVYYIASSWTTIGKCSGTLPIAALSKVATDILNLETSSVPDVYYSSAALKSLGQQIPQPAKIVKAVQAALKKDDSIMNLGLAFHTAALLPAGSNAFAFDRIEDAIVQADEVDGRTLQYEGGLSITALVVSGAYSVAEVVGKPPPLTPDQVMKFASYFVSRRSVQTPKGAYSLLNVAQILTTNKFHIPVILSIHGANYVTSEQPKLTVKVSDLLGNPLPGSGIQSLTVESAAKQPNGVVIISKKKFDQNPTDKVLHSVSLLDSKPEAGVYKVIVSGSSSDARFIGATGVTLTVRVMATGVLSNIQIGSGDSDQTTAPKMHTLTYPTMLSTVLEVDSQQKLVIRFGVKDKITNKPLQVHQAFVRLHNTETDQEVIFITEKAPTNSYKLDLNIGNKAADLGHLSGRYTIELIVGDVALANPVAWKAANVQIRLPSHQASPGKSNLLGDPRTFYAPKPEIQHLFREPEKRPPAFVSNLFTGLVLLPLLILFILWIKLGVNISNFPFSLSAIGFHLGLGGIFCLFGMFWLQFNMFITLKYLLGLAIITFLCGNSMLTSIAAKKKSSH